MTMMASKAKRKGASLNPGTLSPNPWDLSLSGQNVWHYTGDTRTEDKAPQECDLSADLSAGMITGGCHAKAAQTQIQTRPRVAYCRPKMVLTKGSAFGGKKLFGVVGNMLASREQNVATRYIYAARHFDIFRR